MPKQFISLLERSLFELTGKRLQPLGQPYVVAVREFEALTKTFAAKLGLPKEHLLSEPFAKNTAPAIALICRYLELRGSSKEIVGVFPADHVIGNDQAFLAAINVATKQAESGSVVTLGIKPSEPSTGFGYIELEKITDPSNPTAVRALRFREKPDLATAKEYLSTGRFVWNAGIFFFKVDAMIEMFKRFAPDVWNPLAELKADLSNLEAVYAKMPSISFDYAIMEKVDTQYCVPCDPVWSDLGSWDDVV
ncbi:MAG: mannose-1-phosphate guanylyltransferase, partial [Bdellovibrionota bacterium]